ncbi:ATPase [Paenibacillus cineris]|uniref:Nuclease SbcCD subunit C n=1 Tax=Paenibacillus cineris TaxID=237530 RepID=A0ABQ4LN91_9BACL|nr:ATPase [Paenibacillus cineris]GIO57959.1 hypothetical protein J21TS7_62770 [Paenibacillus cineris]
MAKHFRFIRQDLVNFAGLQGNTLVEYGDITKLSGKNGEGKTSIGTGPVWTFYGTDINGSKYNPSPTTYEFDRVYAALSLEVDGEQVEFAREIDQKGKNAFFINSVPAKAKEYEEAVAALFDKEDFLAMYNPVFFFTQHWTKQREQILKYSVPPAKNEVLKEMSRTSPDEKAKDIKLNPAASKLDELMKKHSLDDLQKIHGGTGGQKSKLEKQYIAAQSRTKTLQEQLQQTSPKGGASIDLVAAQTDIAKLDAHIAEIKESMSGADENNRKINALDARIKYCMAQRELKKAQFPTLQNEPIADTCRVCKQPLQGDAVEAAKADKTRRITEFKDEFDAIVSERKELEVERASLEYIDVSEKLDEVRRLQEARQSLVDSIREAERRQLLAEQIEQARADEAATLTSLKESIFILDSIKAYRAKEAELQAAKVQSLFTRLQIRLFKFVKSSGEYEPDFSIQMDGKDYVSLSVGEKITAGLELIEVLHKQSGLIVPTFIDGIGEYTGDIVVYDQVITARAVKGQELKIESEIAVR